MKSASFSTSSHITTANTRLWTINLGAVLGEMATGGGASHLQQLMASTGIPAMSKSTFTATERYITNDLRSMLADSIIEAGKEERNNAEKSNRYFHGVPAITVIADGGWSKRSHKHSYNAKSGIAVIIGQHTKKLLFLRVRNKYCSVCSIAENAGKEKPTHQCIKIGQLPHQQWNQTFLSKDSDKQSAPMEYVTCS